MDADTKKKYNKRQSHFRPKYYIWRDWAWYMSSDSAVTAIQRPFEFLFIRAYGHQMLSRGLTMTKYLTCHTWTACKHIWLRIIHCSTIGHSTCSRIYCWNTAGVFLRAGITYSKYDKYIFVGADLSLCWAQLQEQGPAEERTTALTPVLTYSSAFSAVRSDVRSKSYDCLLQLQFQPVLAHQILFFF